MGAWSSLPVQAEPDPPAAGERNDWLRLVPGEARFYVEIRDLSGVQKLFQRLGIWETVRKLAEEDSVSATSQPWRRTSEEYLGLTPDRAIRLFLGRRAALIATESAQWQGGVVLAELEERVALGPWLKRWRARSLADEGAVRRYELSGGVLLAMRDNVLAFGPAGDSEGLWARTVLLMAGRRGPTLAGRSEVAALRSRMAMDHPVTLYAAWAEGDDTAPAGLRRLLVGASVTAAGISCEFHGQRGDAADAGEQIDASWLHELPRSTLAVRSASFDFDSFLQRPGTRTGAQQDPLISLLLRGFLGEGRQPDSAQPKLERSYCLVFGRDRSSSRGFDLPAVTLVCRGRETEGYVDRLDHTLGFLAILLGRAALPPEGTPAARVQLEECEGVKLHHLEIGPSLAKRTGLSFVDHLDICWASHGGRLILSSSLAQTREIILASAGKGERLGDEADAASLLPSVTDGEAVVEWWFARGSRIAEMLANWRRYLEREQPEALQAQWWQQWAAQQNTHRARLGVGLVADAKAPYRAIVREVSRGSPAIRHLRVGDVIVGAEGSRLTTSQPAQEVAERYGLRANDGRFELEIIRAGKSVKVSIPVPADAGLDLDDFDPIRGLDQWTTLCRCARTATVWVYGGGPNRLDARVLIQWEQFPKPASRGPGAASARPSSGDKERGK